MKKTLMFSKVQKSTAKDEDIGVMAPQYRVGQRDGLKVVLRDRTCIGENGPVKKPEVLGVYVTRFTVHGKTSKTLDAAFDKLEELEMARGLRLDLVCYEHRLDDDNRRIHHKRFYVYIANENKSIRKAGEKMGIATTSHRYGDPWDLPPKTYYD